MKNKPGRGELNGFLGRGAEFKGELRFDDQVRIDGKFRGKIFSENLLVIGEEGDVDAEIRVGHLIVEGKVSGKIEARDKIEVMHGGEIYGEIISPNLVINEGSVFQGKCGMGVKEKGAAETLKRSAGSLTGFRRDLK